MWTKDTFPTSIFPATIIKLQAVSGSTVIPNAVCTFSAICSFKGHGCGQEDAPSVQPSPPFAEKLHTVGPNLSASAACGGSVGSLLEIHSQAKSMKSRLTKEYFALQASEGTRRYHHWWTHAFGKLLMKSPWTFFLIYTQSPSPQNFQRGSLHRPPISPAGRY